MTHRHNAMDTELFMWIALFCILLFGVPAMYALHAGSINNALLELAHIELRPFTYFSDEAAIALERITAAKPEALTWEQMQKVLHYAGTWFRWPCALLLLLLGTVSLFMGRTKGLTRHFTMAKLIEHNASAFACLCPIVGKGKDLLSPESHDKGLWRIARSPIQFAVEHGLLLDEQGNVFSESDVLRNGLAYADLPAYGHAYLHEEQTTAILQEQLGKPFTEFADLSPCRQALATAFLAYAAGDKTTCMNVLDALSASYIEKDGQASCPIAEQEDFAKMFQGIWEKHKALLNNTLVLRHTSFELPWFMALLTLARKKGVLASSQFLWLRPFDRPLWYALNQCGGRAAWVEAFAAWAHYAAEEKTGKPIEQAHVAHAVLRLKETLAQSGILASKAQELESSGASIQGEMVFVPSESDPEYDAYADPSLNDEMC